MATKEKAPASLVYKGKPLVRNGNTLYYGDMADEYVVMMQILDTGTFEDLKLPQRVAVQLLSTDDKLPLKDRIKKRGDKPNLFDAIHMATVWLERALDE